MKKKYLRYQIVSALVCLVAIVSIILPGGEGKEWKKTYDFPTALMSSEENAEWTDQLSKALQNYQIELQVPESAWLGRSFIIQMNFTKRAGIDDSALTENGISSFILEEKLEMDDISVEPGEDLLLPIQLPQTTFIQMKVTPQTSGEKQGKVWITIIATNENSISVPIFVLPIEIQIYSFFGLKTGIWQIIWACLGAAGMVVLIFSTRKKRA